MRNEPLLILRSILQLNDKWTIALSQRRESSWGCRMSRIAGHLISSKSKPQITKLGPRTTFQGRSSQTLNSEGKQPIDDHERRESEMGRVEIPRPADYPDNGRNQRYSWCDGRRLGFLGHRQGSFSLLRLPHRRRGARPLPCRKGGWDWGRPGKEATASCLLPQQLCSSMLSSCCCRLPSPCAVYVSCHHHHGHVYVYEYRRTYARTKYVWTRDHKFNLKYILNISNIFGLIWLILAK